MVSAAWETASSTIQVCFRLDWFSKYDGNDIDQDNNYLLVRLISNDNGTRVTINTEHRLKVYVRYY